MVNSRTGTNKAIATAGNAAVPNPSVVVHLCRPTSVDHFDHKPNLPQRPGSLWRHHAAPHVPSPILSEVLDSINAFVMLNGDSDVTEVTKGMASPCSSVYVGCVYPRKEPSCMHMSVK